MTVDPEVTEESAPIVPIRFFERTAPLFAAFLLVAAFALGIAMRTVHDRPQGELVTQSGSARSHVVLSHWIGEGYFHYLGLLNREPDKTAIYLNSTGGYMVSGFVVEKLYSMIAGHYSYRLLALHNQVVAMFIAALAGLLSYRLSRRLGIGERLAFAAGASVVAILFNFPDNLDLFWEMSAQAYGLLFALLFVVLEERAADLPSRPRALLIAQAATVFLMTVMESIVALGFVLSLTLTMAVLGRTQSWKRFLLVVALPCFAALGVYQLQLAAAKARFPKTPISGSRPLWRTGLDGESLYYGDHLGIATRRDGPRINWKINRENLFVWKWVFILGLVSVLGVLIAFIARRAPRIALDVLVPLIGAWLMYAAVFSQALVIHPYLYDVLLFTPLCIALFALAPSLLESMTRRTGAIMLVVVFSAVWYSFFQLRLYALRRPMPPVPSVASPVK